MPKTSDHEGLSKAEMSDCLEVVESLSQKEKNKILSVLQKDEKLRQGQEMKINLLKKDIQEIRMKGILRAGDDQEKMCRRCRTELGFLFNRGSICPICRFKVCRACQEFMFNGSWICIFCYKTRQLKWMTGEWATFQQNPLRKWASGSDIIRASFQLKPGPSIDIDEPQQNGSNKQSNKSSRNGKAGGEPTRSRVDAPKDADQHKLSQLFDVLRPKRQEESVKETQIRRVTSRRYDESDSDSSSSSDVENKSGRSSPHALSVTESEKDAQVGVVNNDNESRRLSDTGSLISTDSSRTSASNDRVKERPRPAPRSPKPSPRKLHSDINDSDRVVRPKVRPERKSEDNRVDRHANLSVDDSSRVTLSRSVDTNLGKSAAVDIDRNRRAVSDAQLNNVRKSNQQLSIKTRDQADVEVCEEQIVASQKPFDNESAILMNDSPVLGRRKSGGNGDRSEVSVEVHPNVNSTEEQQQLSTNTPGQGEEIRIEVPRDGSPYSISMDSLPSSHPSPTLHRGSIGGSSHADSSDTDSLSRMSHPEHGEFSGTESAQHAHDEDFDVEEISKVRFQRVSKNLGQMGVLAKLAKSPRKKLAGLHDAPQTISECSVSQDDSGLVSGGSRGATPEHRRTDSGYSQSSLPSTLSTVTDDSRESIASYYSDAGNIAYSTVPVTGDILFSINYNYKTSMLEIGIKQCKDIAAADTKKNRSDPYVKTYLLPDRTRSGKRKTKVKKHTLNPTFDETLKYSISKSELENRTLWVTLWHSDRFGRNIFLGEVTINFDYYKFDNPSARWYQLQERIDGQPSSMMVYKGDLSLCIRYVPADKITSPKGKGKQKKESSKGQLEVIVKEARNLTAVRSNGFSDPFCKGYLLPERHKSSKQKTAVIKKDCNPVWNYTLIFEDVSLMELRERCLELTIWDYEKLSSNDFLGGVRLNLGTGVSQGKQVEWMDARGEEMSMWQAMLDRPNLWIDGALILRPNMDKRQY